MASNSKTSLTFNLNEAIVFIQGTDVEDYSDSDSGGMSSGEESEIDCQLLNSEDKVR
jgi:hypothetical protein